MISLNLMNKAVSGIQYEILTFPDGEPHIKMDITPYVAAKVGITTRLRNPNDLLLLTMAVDILRANQFEPTELSIPYLMGARMDRRVSEKQPFTLKIVSQIIDSLEIPRVRLYHPHSIVSEALIENSTTITNSGFISEVLSKLPQDVILISPDQGAYNMVSKLATEFKREHIGCGKKRDPLTGNLSGFISGAATYNWRPLLIVDDLCDGGGTFVGLAEELKKREAGALYLAVTHGIFSKGIGVLKDFKHVYYTNSYSDEEEKINSTQIKIW